MRRPFSVTLLRAVCCAVIFLITATVDVAEAVSYNGQSFTSYTFIGSGSTFTFDSCTFTGSQQEIDVTSLTYPANFLFTSCTFASGSSLLFEGSSSASSVATSSLTVAITGCTFSTSYVLFTGFLPFASAVAITANTFTVSGASYVSPVNCGVLLSSAGLVSSSAMSISANTVTVLSLIHI